MQTLYDLLSSSIVAVQSSYFLFFYSYGEKFKVKDYIFCLLERQVLILIYGKLEMCQTHKRANTYI